MVYLRTLFIALLLIANASPVLAKLPVHTPFEPPAGDHGAYSVKETPFDGNDPFAAKVYDNFSLAQGYVLNGISWSGIFAEAIPNPASAVDFLIEIWANTGTSAAGPGGAPDLANRKAQFILKYGVASGSTGGSFEVRATTPSTGAHLSPTTGTTPGGGPALDYHANLIPTFLPAGDYWISIQSVQAFDSPFPTIDPEWQWHFGVSKFDNNGQPAGDGYQAADLELNSGAGLLGSFVASGLDMAFKLYGVQSQAIVDKAQFIYNHSTASPLNIFIQSSVNINPVYPAGQYEYFYLSLNWKPLSGSPQYDDLQFQIETAAGTSAFVFPQLAQSDKALETKLVFVGKLPGTYDPNVDATINFKFQSAIVGAGVEISNLDLHLVAPSNNPVDIVKIFDGPEDFVSANLQNGEVQWVKLLHAGGELVVDTVGSTFDTELGVYSKDGMLLGANDDFFGLQSQVILPGLEAGTYYAAASSFNSQFSDGFYVTTRSFGSDGLLKINANIVASDFCFPIKASNGAVAVICL